MPNQRQDGRAGAEPETQRSKLFEGFKTEQMKTSGATINTVHGGKYIGVDISPTAIERMASRTDKRTRFMVADAETLALQDQFDLVVLNEVLYLFRDPMAILTRLRVMAPAGAFIISMADFGFRATLRIQKI